MRLFIFLLLTALNFQHVNGQANRKGDVYAKAIQQAKRFVDSLRQKQDIPGISVCVGTKDKILWAAGFGLADVENKVPITTESKFRIGSVSKSLTSVALGKLIEEGKLDLDASINQYVPNFPQKKFPITSRQLATHTAGIRHYGPNDPLNCLKRYETVQDGLVIFSQDTLLFRPGTAYNYSTYGYNLLSAVIEGVSHSDFLSYMQTAVFTPLGMSHTSPDYSEHIIPNRVRFYEHTKTQVVNAAQVDNSYKWAGGGFLSTPSDLVVFGSSLLAGKGLKKETVTLLFTPQLLENGKNTYYGFGWRVGTDSKGRKIIHHGGTIDGGRTFLMLYPDDNLVVAIAANMQQGVTINVSEVEAIAQYFLHK
ncbi:serine hydrolase [Spirosoma sp. HMF4905]|uniref:Serine hydrolase n=1 Tax=Spirosoma arboris TaxID=2682092 RepID=A0A7K1SDC0_9BACT|nr:serine hydrolase domain-containing protein [Spirosoma arboris]MVM31785.1 serine hydrolase [Spirosoma arboris]